MDDFLGLLFAVIFIAICAAVFALTLKVIWMGFVMAWTALG